MAKKQNSLPYRTKRLWCNVPEELYDSLLLFVKTQATEYRKSALLERKINKLKLKKDGSI